LLAQLSRPGIDSDEVRDQVVLTEVETEQGRGIELRVTTRINDEVDQGDSEYT
jgi:hypothetical protein